MVHVDKLKRFEGDAPRNWLDIRNEETEIPVEPALLPVDELLTNFDDGDDQDSPPTQNARPKRELRKPNKYDDFVCSRITMVDQMLKRYPEMPGIKSERSSSKSRTNWSEKRREDGWFECSICHQEFDKKDSIRKHVDRQHRSKSLSDQPRKINMIDRARERRPGWKGWKLNTDSKPSPNSVKTTKEHTHSSKSTKKTTPRVIEKGSSKGRNELKTTKSCTESRPVQDEGHGLVPGYKIPKVRSKPEESPLVESDEDTTLMDLAILLPTELEKQLLEYTVEVTDTSRIVSYVPTPLNELKAGRRSEEMVAAIDIQTEKPEPGSIELPLGLSQLLGSVLGIPVNVGPDAEPVKATPEAASCQEVVKTGTGQPDVQQSANTEQLSIPEVTTQREVMPDLMDRSTSSEIHEQERVQPTNNGQPISDKSEVGPQNSLEFPIDGTSLRISMTSAIKEPIQNSKGVDASQDSDIEGMSRARKSDLVEATPIGEYTFTVPTEPVMKSSEGETKSSIPKIFPDHPE